MTVPRRLIPLPALATILGVNPVTAWRRAKSGRYGEIYRVARHGSVSTEIVENAIGRVITPQEIQSAHIRFNQKAKLRYRPVPRKPALPLKGEAGYVEPRRNP